MEQKREREQQRRRDKRSKDSKRGHSNKLDGKSSAPWRSGDVIEREGMAENASSSITPDIGSGANFSRRQVESNWSKYETVLPSYEEESKASDFQSLMTTPMSEGGHFKFKSEQSWEAYSPSQFNKLFTLDLNVLSSSLSTIPFYRQLNLSKELFNNDELERMDKEADKNHARYTSLKETVENAARSVSTTSALSSENIIKPPLSNPIAERLMDLKLSSSADCKDSAGPDDIKQSTTATEELFKSEEDDELDFLLALNEPIKSPVALSKPPTDLGDQQISEETKLHVPSTSNDSKQENLDDWLDSILDE